MLLLAFLSLSLASAVWAQTPPGFSPNVTARLDVIFPSATVTPGLQLQKAAVASMPTIGTETSLSGTYLYVLTSTDTGPSSYFGPSPPAETPPHPHHYIEMLFEQPANFAVPSSMKSQVSSRLNFNTTEFISLAGLKDPVAANYFLITG